eukprot:CAMPEP_0204065684 /NCGR_PEP_ID=MMETSP0360-20130528/150657_1 /ASSEMBLY_ACC=CAM_ASM_000342 /TAXON_ID=268821 /ORGANISM="Scrippsiella Hangoei, Strain SHTV-5" /LENGTH=43 /DNA_ID= /DNA_START= /DNA_END= /DNA_ORIENTATION=
MKSCMPGEPYTPVVEGGQVISPDDPMATPVPGMVQLAGHLAVR